MAAAPIVSTAIGGVTSIVQGQSQARREREMVAQQKRALDDQRILSDIGARSQKQQAESAAFREQLLNNQAEALGLVQNEMAQAQQGIASTQQQIAVDQQAFMNNQRATAREAQAQMQAAEVMNTLNAQAQKALQQGKKNDADINALLLQRLAMQGATASDTQSGQALLERLVNDLATGAINLQSGFTEEQAKALQQLAYETQVSDLERGLGNVGVGVMRQGVANQDVINNIMGDANAQNIRTQTARNQNSIDFNKASSLAESSFSAAGRNAQFRSQSQTLDTQRRAVSGSNFASLLGAVGNLGMSLYGSGIFNRTPSSSGGGGGYSIFGGARIPTFDTYQSLGGAQLPSNASFTNGNNTWSQPGANDLFRNIG